MTDTRSNTLQHQPWLLITALGAFALVRPVLSIAGVYDSGPLEKPLGPILLTVLIAVVWLGTVVALRTPEPVVVLTLTGVAYGVLAIVLNLVLQPFLDDAEAVSVPGAIGMLASNALQGVVLGLIAMGIQRVTSRGSN